MDNKLLGIGLIALSGIGALPAQAQRVSIDAALHTAERPYVQATGEATVSAKPDQAVIEIGVIAQGQTAAAVAAQNARQTDSVLAELAGMLGAGKKIRTTNYSVRPNYQSPKPGTAAAITGYTATNIVEITLDDLSQVSKVIDSAARSGANVIQKLEYQLKNPSAVREQALRKAAEQAKAAADAIAAGIGLKVVRVLSAEEVTPDEDFGMHKRAMPSQAAPGSAPVTPLEVGMIEVSANVIVRVEVGQ